MENLSQEYMTRAEFWLLLNCLIYFLMNGAQIFETLVFVPKWTVNPPYNFHYLTDKNGTSLKSFWTAFHSIHEIIFITSIVFAWHIPTLRNWLVSLFILHFSVRIWTIVYFAKNIIEFQGIDENSELGNLAIRTANWKKWNYVRVAIFVTISITLATVYWFIF
ncbi:MAG: transposase [Bacteroidetes bacterium]|nr:transposase [Bacteroidota bacterium]